MNEKLVMAEARYDEISAKLSETLSFASLPRASTTRTKRLWKSSPRS